MRRNLTGAPVVIVEQHLKQDASDTLLKGTLHDTKEVVPPDPKVTLTLEYALAPFHAEEMTRVEIPRVAGEVPEPSKHYELIVTEGVGQCLLGRPDVFWVGPEGRLRQLPNAAFWADAFRKLIQGLIVHRYDNTPSEINKAAYETIRYLWASRTYVNPVPGATSAWFSQIATQAKKLTTEITSEAIYVSFGTEVIYPLKRLAPRGLELNDGLVQKWLESIASGATYLADQVTGLGF